MDAYAKKRSRVEMHEKRSIRFLSGILICPVGRVIYADNLKCTLWSLAVILLALLSAVT